MVRQRLGSKGNRHAELTHGQEHTSLPLLKFSLERVGAHTYFAKFAGFREKDRTTQTLVISLRDSRRGESRHGGGERRGGGLVNMM